MKRKAQLFKAPPHDLQAERGTLGCLFLNPSCVPKVMKIVQPGDFYSEAHIEICTVFFELKLKADLITVSDALAKKGLLERCGGIDYLASMVDFMATSAGVTHYAKIIRELSERRKLISHCLNTVDKAYGLHNEIEEILADHKARIRGLQSDLAEEFRDNRALIRLVLKDIEERAKSANRFVGIKTGFENIDLKIYGLEPKTTSYLIARPSMGKTALALNIAGFVSSKYRGKVIFFSLESGDVALTRRRLSAQSSVFLSRIRRGEIKDSQWEDLIKAANILSENNLIIIDRARYKTIENLVAMSETLAMESPLSLIVIDHLQRMRCRKWFQNRHLEISFISEQISSLANELNIPILVLSQLSRKVEDRVKRDQRPRLSDMKESGDLEANADVVWGLYRETKESEIAYLDQLKGRDSGSWCSFLKFDRFIQKFSDCDEHDAFSAENAPERGMA